MRRWVYTHTHTEGERGRERERERQIETETEVSWVDRCECALVCTCDGRFTHTRLEVRFFYNPLKPEDGLFSSRQFTFAVQVVNFGFKNSSMQK